MSDQPLDDMVVPDPEPDPIELQTNTLIDLQADVNTWNTGNNIVVIAIYVLPDDCRIGPPSTQGGILVPPGPDGLNGVPPGNKSAVYVFPLMKATGFNQDTLAPDITKRFRKSSQIQAIIATSNHLYVNAATVYEDKHPVDVFAGQDTGED